MRPFGKDAYTLEAVIEAGLTPEQARLCLADGPRAVPERARVSMTGRKRTEPTTRYVWGPDANWLLGLTPTRKAATS
jgi:hypothetical protein